jgi:hypothetical protein
MLDSGLLHLVGRLLPRPRATRNVEIWELELLVTAQDRADTPT